MTNRQLAAMKRRMSDEWTRAHRQTKTEDHEEFRSPLMAAIEKAMTVIDEETDRRKRS